MKKSTVNFITMIVLTYPLLAGCGFFLDCEEVVKEVYECLKGADQYETPSVRQKVLNECVELMIEYEGKLNSNPNELDAYNDYFPCH